jgi:hypothetical protein
MRGCGTPRWILAQTWRECGSCGRNYLLKLVKLCQYNSQIHRVPAGRIVTNKQTNYSWATVWGAMPHGILRVFKTILYENRY